MAFDDLAAKLGMNIPLRQALEEIEADRLELMSGPTFFAWPVRARDVIFAFFRDSSWELLSSVALGVLVAMFLIDALPSIFYLRWTQEPKLRELPDGVKRVMIQGTEGRLELLISESKSEKPSKPAILLLHGAFGSATVYLPWMTHLQSSYAGSVYSLSLRGHGGSFTPGYLEMAFLTSMTTLTTDIGVALREIATRETSSGKPRGIILCAHGLGGGLIQHALASGRLPKSLLSRIGGLKGLALLAATPPFGSAGVFWNWFMADPFMYVRSALHFYHPRSALSSTKAVRRIFFSEEIAVTDVEIFQKAMPAYESVIWPSQMLFGRFVDADEVLSRMSAKNVLIITADGDELMGVSGQRKMAREYANVLRSEDMESAFTNVHDVRIVAEGTVGGEKHQTGLVGSMQLNLIRGSGHQIMSDVKTEEAAEVFRKWADGV